MTIMITASGAPVVTDKQPFAYIIDDDGLVREALADLLRSVGLGVQAFASTYEFLRSKRPDAPGCIVLDVRLPGTSGLDFQRSLAEVGITLPVVFISGHGDISMSVRAMKSGAIEFLTKPLREQELLDAVHAGIERDIIGRRQVGLLAELQQRLASLTAREREVVALVVAGHPNKQIAHLLNLSEMTVKVHRSHIMQKMQARSLIDLVRMTDRLGIPVEKP